MSLMKHLAENFQLYPEVQGGVPVGKFISASWRIDWTGLQDWIDKQEHTTWNHHDFGKLAWFASK